MDDYDTSNGVHCALKIKGDLFMKELLLAFWNLFTHPHIFLGLLSVLAVSALNNIKIDFGGKK